MDIKWKELLIKTCTVTVIKLAINGLVSKSATKMFDRMTAKQYAGVDPRTIELLEAVKADRNVYEVIKEMCDRENEKSKTKTQELKEKWGIK